MPDRAQVTMTTHCMRSYSLLTIKTCHRRGAHAMGGMAAQIPIKSDPAANEIALEKVREDKEREAGDGHDGTWVAHPGLVPIAMEVFNARMPTPHQRDRLREDVHVTAPGSADCSHRNDHRSRACASTSMSVSAIWKAGCAARGACRSSTSWKTPRPARSRARRSGSGFITHGGCSATAARSPPSCSGPSWRRSSTRSAPISAPRASNAASSSCARTIFDETATAQPLVDFLTLPAYEQLP